MTQEAAVSNGTIPADLALFQDHFPGFPVLPGVLALELLRGCAESILQKSDFLKAKQLRGVEGVKFQQMLRPGDAWESRITLLSETPQTVSVDARLLAGGKTAVSATLIFS